MRVALPATIADDVLGTLADLVLKARGYLTSDDFRLRRLEVDIDKLMRVDAVNGHIAKAGLFHLLGDDRSARYHVECAGRLKSDPAVDSTLTTILANLGFFSESQLAFRRAADPRRGDYSTAIRFGLCCGAFNATCELMEQAERLGFATPSDVAQIALTAQSVLASEQVSDNAIGEILDFAGELMRSERVFYQGVRPEINVVNDSDLGRCVYFLLPLPVEVGRVADLQFVLVDRLVERFPVLPNSFSVGFRSTE
jgi:hypothetical protein